MIYLKQYVVCYQQCVLFSARRIQTLPLTPAIILPMKSKNSCTL